MVIALRLVSAALSIAVTPQHGSTISEQTAVPRILRRRYQMKQLVKNLLNDESGQDLIEYALIAALIALAAIGAMQTLGSKIGNEFNSVGSSL